MSTPGVIREVDVHRMPSEDLAALLAVSAALASTLDLPVTMQTAITSACKVMGLDTGAIYLLDDAMLVLQATTPPIPADFPAEYLEAPLEDHPHIATCLSSLEPVWIDDAASEMVTEAERGVCAARGLRSVLFVPLAVDGEALGAFILGSVGAPASCTAADLDLSRALAHQISLAVANARLHDSLVEANRRLAQAYDATLQGWAAALEMRDRETGGHSDRVERLTLRLAAAMGVPPEEREHLRRGALLHDIGKMAVPDSILQKAGPLTEEEWEVMRQHPVRARDLLAGIDFLRPALVVPYCHHERWDGSGYPQGLAGEEIPLLARIFAVVDVYEALTEHRPYRPAWPREQAIAHLRDGAGRQFDPEVVRVFLRILEEPAPPPP